MSLSGGYIFPVNKEIIQISDFEEDLKIMLYSVTYFLQINNCVTEVISHTIEKCQHRSSDEFGAIFNQRPTEKYKILMKILIKDVIENRGKKSYFASIPFTNTCKHRTAILTSGPKAAKRCLSKLANLQNKLRGRKLCH